jgi:hypothetical protein
MRAAPEKIVSGGQTGADRAALDWAIRNAVAHGGWCPKGRRSEDGEIPAHYHLTELNSKSYLQRTRRNVMDSDGTVIFSIKPTLTGGSKRTAEFAREHRKPMLHIDAGAENPGETLRRFIESHSISVLNVAGPRESTEPRICEFVMQVLNDAFPSSEKP